MGGKVSASVSEVTETHLTTDQMKRLNGEVGERKYQLWLLMKVLSHPGHGNSGVRSVRMSSGYVQHTKLIVGGYERLDRLTDIRKKK